MNHYHLSPLLLAQVKAANACRHVTALAATVHQLTIELDEARDELDHASDTALELFNIATAIERITNGNQDQRSA